jgi:ADP-ribosylglycohydrolase
MRYIGQANAGRQDQYDPNEFLQKFYHYMVTPPDPNDTAQLAHHNDTYLDVYLRGFFTNASNGKELKDCAMNQRESWSIGSIDGVAMAIPIIVAYSYQPEWYVVGRAIEHAHLTHRSITVTASLSILVPLLLELYRQPTDPNQAALRLRSALDTVLEKMAPPKWTGRAMRDSYVDHKGPANIPKDVKWNQHMELDTSETTKEFVHRLVVEIDNDEDVAGFGDRPSSRLSTACYCEQTLTVVLFLAYKYADDPRKALLQNVMLGGHSTSRGAVLGAILGAAYGTEGIPFQNDLCAKEAIDKEISDLVTNVVG